MVRILVVLLATTAVVYCQFNMASLSLNREFQRQSLTRTSCKYKYDQNSPFFWNGIENMCTKQICDDNPFLECNMTAEHLWMQANNHKPENISREVKFLQRYFDTFIPRPNYREKRYRCSGVCDKRPELVEMIFHDASYIDQYTGNLSTVRTLCHVIGPRIYRKSCDGHCNLGRFGISTYCVPDVTVSMDAWVYCPNVAPGCRKIRIDIPLSCSCREIQCFKPPPAVSPVLPRLPDSFFDELAGMHGTTDASWATGPTEPTQPTPPLLGVGKLPIQKPQNIPIWP